MGISRLLVVWVWLHDWSHQGKNIEFSRNYTKLAMLSFLYCFVVKGKLI